ncbi:hypothetical protein QBC36DRAFT_390435 [Triangularia setosa]|uniref:Kinesin light chain n=1 Tax=Triangularia setosa TaxID=2587417 RepID=A0AAN6VZQ2_9PEZI|nr:hypothetical protein QBC36DRAFT_390435 [Podospora setosa]
MNEEAGTKRRKWSEGEKSRVQRRDVGEEEAYTYNPQPTCPETPPQLSATVPFSRDPDFVNRGDILDQINKRCSEPAARVALVGLGGIGKSQLAIEYAHRIAAGQPDGWVFWVHAGTQARVEEGFRTIANAVKLAGRNRPKVNIPQLVIALGSGHGNQVRTDARPCSAGHQPGCCLHPGQGTAELAGKILSRVSSSTMLETYGGMEARQTRFSGHGRYHLTISGLSGAPAEDLLSLMSPFDRQGVPEWVLNPPRTAKNTIGNNDTDNDTDNDIDNVKHQNIDDRFEDDVAMLRDYCLIVVDEIGDKFEMHSLVQLSTRKWLEAFGEQETFKYVRKLGYLPVSLRARSRYATLASTSMLAMVLLNRGRWKEAKKLFVQVMETRKTKLGTDHPDTLTSMNNLACTWKSQGRHSDALALMRDYALSSLAAVAKWSS